MNTKNLWELKIIEKYTPLNTTQEILNAIKEGLLLNFELKDKFIPGEEINNALDNFASKNNFILNYTDENHPAFMLKESSSTYSNYINPSFFKQYETEIKKAFLEGVKKTNNTVFIISSNIFSDELLDELLRKDDIYLYLKDVDPTEEQIKKIKDRYIDAYIEKDGNKIQISSRFVFPFYTKKDLEDLKYDPHIRLEDLRKNDITNLRFLKDNSIIVYNKNYNMSEEEELRIIKDNLEKLDTLNKHFIFKFEINRRSNFNKVFKNTNFKNIELVIENDYYDYPLNQYLEEEKKLEELVKDIKTSNLSQFEKFIAVYNIVKNYKEFKENENNRDQARALRYILDNEYMVCVG